MNASESAPKSSRCELVGLLSRHQRKIFAYLYTLVPNQTDADDLLQETCLTIYEKFDEFEPGTDFVAWANRSAQSGTVSFVCWTSFPPLNPPRNRCGDCKVLLS